MESRGEIYTLIVDCEKVTTLGETVNKCGCILRAQGMSRYFDGAVTKNFPRRRDPRPRKRTKSSCHCGTRMTRTRSLGRIGEATALENRVLLYDSGGMR